MFAAIIRERFAKMGTNDKSCFSFNESSVDELADTLPAYGGKTLSRSQRLL